MTTRRGYVESNVFPETSGSKKLTKNYKMLLRVAQHCTIPDKIQQYNMQLPGALFGLSLKIFPLKNFLYFFLKKSCSEKVSYTFPKKAFLLFRKRNFLIFQERYICNPSTIRTRSIFSNLVYSEHEAHSEHCQTSTMERFSKIATQCTF